MIYTKHKSILSANNNVNLYRGCQHGCIYCDARSTCYQVKNYEEIEVKENAINILDKELKNKRKKVVVRSGGMSDPYMPLEGKLLLTRQMLEKIEQYGHGIYILTKSTLILRDLDMYKKINKNNTTVVALTLTTFDDDLCGIVEPHVARTSKRLEVLKQFAQAGITTGVWLCPLLPYINDSEENMIKLIEAMHQVDVKFIVNYGMGLTLRDGNRQYYYDKLDIHFPGLKELYIKQYGDNYILPSPNEKRLYELFKALCDKYGIVYDFDRIENITAPFNPYIEELL